MAPRSTSTAPRPSNASVTASAGQGPSSAGRSTAPKLGKRIAAGSSREPSTPPPQKNGKATHIRREPCPAATSVPEPHPFASCMPMPKIAAPSTSAVPMGATNRP